MKMKHKHKTNAILKKTIKRQNLPIHPADFAVLLIENIEKRCKCLHFIGGMEFAIHVCKKGDTQWKNDNSSQESCSYS